MRKISEILQQGLNQVKEGIDSPYTGMCIIVSCMIGKGVIDTDELQQTEEVIAHARKEQGLASYAYLVSALRSKHKLNIEDKQLDLLWIQWYEKLIAELQAKGE